MAMWNLSHVQEIMPGAAQPFPRWATLLAGDTGVALWGRDGLGEQEGSGAVEVGLEWRALGPVEAIVDGRLVNLGPPMQRMLFGLLLSRVDRPVALDALVEQLWSGDPPPAAMASLWTYVSNLRRVLEPRRGPRAPAAVLRT